jgi:putative ABC transport system permease protein
MTRRKMYIRMITASLVRRRSRMVIALLSIAIGATILSGLVTIYYDVPRQMGAQFRNYGANMILTASEDEFTEDDVNAAEELISGNALIGAAPYRYESVRINEQPVMAAGTDMDGVQKTSPYWLVDGDFPSAQNEIMVGESVSESLNLKVGDNITVNFTREDTEYDNSADFTVTGILQTGGSEENYVYMSLDDMEALTGERGSLDVCELSISATSDELDSYMNKINDTVSNVTARLVKRVTASETAVLSKLQALVLLVTIVVLALTMICVATTMTAVVTERRKEIGLRKAIGASDGSLIKEFMGEGILLGGLGGIIGSVLGFIFAEEVSINVFSSSISFRPLLVPITILVSVAVTAVSCIMPIRSATEIDPALVLKGE